MLGFRKAADQLRRDWEINPEDLPFAPSVRPGDLVRLVLDGLHHDEIATGAIAAQIRSSEEAAKRLDASLAERQYKFIFQPSRRELSIRSAPHIARPFEDKERTGSPLKRHRDGINGASTESMGRPPAPKRVRKSTAAELKDKEGAVTANGILHTNEDVQRQPAEDESMTEDGPMQLMSTLDNGISDQAQTEPNGYIQPKELSAIERVIPESNSVIMHSKWSPISAEELLFVGGENTANLWHFPSEDSVNEVDAIQLDIPCVGPYTITSYLWDHKGSKLLLAYDEPDRTGPFGLVSFNRDTSRVELENLDQNTSSCLTLRQNPITHMIIAFSVSGSDQDDGNESGCTQIWREDFLASSSPIGIINHSESVYDGDWVDHLHFAVSCGSNVELYTCVPSDWDQIQGPSVNDIRSASTLQTKQVNPSLLEMAYKWDIVRHVPGTAKIISVSTESMAIAWADTRTYQTQTLNWSPERDGLIIGMEIQSRRTSMPTNRSVSRQSNSERQPSEEREERCAFAVLTDSGKIFVYDALLFTTPSQEKGGWNPTALRRYDIGPFPALAVSFSHSGRFLAIGSLEKVFIYDLRLYEASEGEPVAVWTGESYSWGNSHGKDWNGVYSDGRDEELKEHCLSWNKDDTRLMYALDKRVRVI